MALVKRRFTPDDLRDRFSGMLMLFHRGMPLPECARIAGIPRQQAHRILVQLGYTHHKEWRYRGHKVQ